MKQKIFQYASIAAALVLTVMICLNGRQIARARGQIANASSVKNVSLQSADLVSMHLVRYLPGDPKVDTVQVILGNGADCVPCDAAREGFAAIVAALKARGLKVRVVEFDFGPKSASIRPFVDADQVLVSDRFEFAARTGIRALPFVAIFDTAGKLRRYLSGLPTEVDIRSLSASPDALGDSYPFMRTRDGLAIYAKALGGEQGQR